MLLIRCHLSTPSWEISRIDWTLRASDLDLPDVPGVHVLR